MSEQRESRGDDRPTFSPSQQAHMEGLITAVGLAYRAQDDDDFQRAMDELVSWLLVVAHERGAEDMYREFAAQIEASHG